MKRHFTATAFIVNSHNQTLLLWHKRLERWMPPGGHIDDNETPEDTAARECKEETGLDVEIIGDTQEDLFHKNPQEGRMLTQPLAMLLEEIPASTSRNEPAHQHMDFLFIAKPIDESQPIVLEESEGTDIRWFAKQDIEKLDATHEIFANVQQYILSILP